jgi:hypothetical protein
MIYRYVERGRMRYSWFPVGQVHFDVALGDQSRVGQSLVS